jgi:hypothetical protein
VTGLRGEVTYIKILSMKLPRIREKNLNNISTIVVFLDVIHRPVPEIGTSSIDWAQLSTFHLKKETESSLRNVEYLN